MFSNDFATLTHYKDALNRKVVDYVIRFHAEQDNLEVIVKQTFQVVKELIDYYHYEKGETVSGRLVALVKYFHIDKEEIVSYYHPSYQAEVIEEADNFYFDHMLKIGERMNNFNHQGSNLIMKNIQEIHFHITVID